MKRINRLLSLILAIMLVVGVLPITVSAMQVYVYISIEESTITLNVEAGDSIENVKQKIQDKEGISPDTINLFFNGTLLNDGRTLGDYNIKNEDTIQVKLKHSHCVCGGNINIGDHTSHSDITFTEWTYTDSMPDTAGNYVLMNDVTITETWKPAIGVTTLCLNGHTLTYSGNAINEAINIMSATNIADNRTLNICDCSNNSGKITGGKNSGIVVSENGVLNLYNGKICNNSSPYTCGGIYLNRSTFNMYGGAVSNNSAEDGDAGGLMLDVSSNFNMYGGIISANTASNSGGGAFVTNSATFKMQNGIISENQSGKTGGGVHNNGTFIINGGTVTENISTNSTGGGVWSANDTTISISGNTIITENTGNSTTNNLHLAGDGTNNAKIDVGTMETTASVGVSTDTNHSKEISVGGKTNKDNFFSDNGAYAVAVDIENLKFVEKTVQVGKVNLYDGEYTADGETVTTTAPTSGGYAHFENGVMTLNNFTYSDSGLQNRIVYSDYDLTINLVGTNAITNTSADIENAALRCVWVCGDITIKGAGISDSLTVTTADQPTGNLSSVPICINDGNLVIENCTVVSSAGDVGDGNIYGLQVEDTTIKNAVVEVNSGTSQKLHSAGLSAYDLTITNSTITACSEDGHHNSRGISAYGIMTVTNSIINAQSGNANNSYGISVGGDEAKLVWNSGTMLVSCGVGAIDSDALYIETNQISFGQDYWWRTSASDEYTAGQYSGNNEDGSYLELTTSRLQNEWVSTPTIRGWIYNTVKSAPQAEAKYGTVEFKYYDADKNLLIELPDNAGTYYLKGFVAETDSYTGLESDYVGFVVEKDEQIPPRPTGVNTTYIDTNDGKITGVDSTMEYRKEGETNYTAVTGTEITKLAAGTYYVRYAATDNYNASGDKKITISLGGKRTPTIDTDPTASRVIIGGKLSDSTLIGGVASVDGTFAWKDGTEVLDSKGTVQKTVVFTPYDTATYNAVEFDVDVTVVICDTASGEHEYTEQKNNADEHWNVCAKCGVEEPDSREEHTYNQEIPDTSFWVQNATCEEPAKVHKSCICGAEGEEIFDYGTAARHLDKDGDGVCDKCTNSVDNSDPILTSYLNAIFEFLKNLFAFLGNLLS